MGLSDTLLEINSKSCFLYPCSIGCFIFRRWKAVDVLISANFNSSTLSSEISSAMYSDCVLIIFIATCTALVGEALTYMLVYRSEQYKKLKSDMERKTKKLERKVGALHLSERLQYYFLMLRRCQHFPPASIRLKVFFRFKLSVVFCWSKSKEWLDSFWVDVGHPVFLRFHWTWSHTKFSMTTYCGLPFVLCLWGSVCRKELRQRQIGQQSVK